MAKKRSWPRRLLIAGGVAMVLLAVLALLALAALRSTAVQQAIVERLSRQTVDAAGFAVDADSFRLRPVAGSLEISGLRLSAPASPPFATVDKLRLRWRPGALFRRPLRLDLVAVERPLIDLEAPLPASAGAAPGSDETTPTSLPIAAERLTIRDGRVTGGQVADKLEGWSVAGLEVDGDFDGRRLTLDRLRGSAALAPGWRDGEAIAVDLELAGAASVDGALEIGRLVARGEHLAAEISGTTDPGLAGARASFEVTADPGWWLSGTPTGGASARGEVDLGRWRGRVELDSGAQPGALIAAFAPPAVAAKAELAGSSLRLTSDLRLTGERSITGDLRLTAFRQDVSILDLEARPDLELSAGLPVEVAVSARLLPGDGGGRRLTARLRTPDARRFAAWTVEDGQLTLEDPDLDRRLRRLAALYPALLPANTLADLPALGSLSASASFAGDLADPKLSARARLRPPDAGQIDLTVDGRPLSGPIAATTAGAGVELAHFVPAASGRLEWNGRAADLFGAARGRLELRATGLASETGPLAESLVAAVEGDRQRLDWRLDARRADGFELTANGTIDPTLPLAAASGEARLETENPRLPRVEGSFDLAGGVLRARATAAIGDTGPVALALTAPLGALDAIPALAAVSEMPIVRGDGPVELEWRAEARSWLALLRRGLGSRIGRLHAGSDGRLTIDPGCPACSRIEATVSGLDLELDGRRVTAEDDLVLRLTDGRLTLEDWRLTGPGLDLAASAQIDLERSWRPGDDPMALASELAAELTATLAEAWIELLPLGEPRPAAVTLAATFGGPPTRPSGTVEIAIPGLPVADAATLPFSLSDGLLRVEGATVATQAGSGALDLVLPVDGRPDGIASLSWDLPANDWAPLLHRLIGGEEPEILEAATRGNLRLDPRRPGAMVATAVLDHARIVAGGRETRVEPALTLEIGDGVASVAPVELRSGGEVFSFQGRAELDPEWSSERAPTEMLLDFRVRGDGSLDAGLLNPFLVGGRGEGALGVTLEIAGARADWEGKIKIEGPEASILYRTPYLTRVEQPSLDLSIVDGVATLDKGSARLNEGRAVFSGLLWDGERSDLAFDISNALFRLDYGLLATLAADLRLRIGPGAGEDGGTLLSGDLQVERASLTRAMRPDLDFFNELLAPVDLTTTEESALDELRLDLRILSREGVRIDNNLASMMVRWEPLTVTGTASKPVIEGRLEAEPGGLIFLYGQTVRLDSASIEYPGVEDAEARLDFEVTTSLEDPTIARLAGDDPFRTTRRGEQPPEADATGDLARYLGEAFAGRVGEAVGVQVSLRPLLIFGETDPGARLTVSRDLSPNFSLAASIDLRQAEAQTYLLEAHELALLPSLVTQVFSDDEANAGAVLLQRQEFGGTRPVDDRTLPRVGKTRVDPPPGVSKRALRRAAGLVRGQPFDADRRFAAEVEVVDFLRGRGYADASVAVRPTATKRSGDRQDLEITVVPGPRAFVDFEGEKLPRSLRRLITDLYRPDFFEPDAIAEMKAETVRALRNAGFLDPRVTVEVEPLDAAEPDGDRLVTVSSVGGTRISPRPPVFLGLPAADVAVLDALFFNPVQRVELAVGLPSADRRLLGALADLGYPKAAIVARYESLTDKALTVEIEPGPRRTIAAVTIESAAGATEPLIELDPLLTVSVGEPLRRRALAASARALERALGSRGHREARVRTILESMPGEDPYATAVRFEVDPGPASRIAGVDFQGLGSTGEKWARRVTGLEPGAPLAGEDLARARSALWRTGLFSAVSSQVAEAEPGSARVVFDLVERPRFRLAYGTRWNSETGLGAVLDATDDNFRGRGWTLGLRAFYSSEEESLRFLTRVPRVFGGPGSLELFLGAREVTSFASDLIFGRTEVLDKILEGTVQYSRPVGSRTTLRLYGRYTDTESQALFSTQRISNPQLGAQYLYDSRSPEPVTLRGVFASVDLSGSEAFLGGDLRYARLFSQLHLHRTLTEPGTRPLTWSQSYRLGLAEAFDGTLTSDVLFFAGGEFSVRGYATESLGEQLRTFTTVEAAGGNSLLVINQELRWRIFDDYTLVVFVDGGEVWPSIGDLGLDLRTAAGLGLRAVTPVGLVRLDLAHALDRRPEIDPEFKLYFGLGTVF